ncbi:helix-turn-helix domain-containing protein [Streptomyces sp. 4503]|uniref:Helix-turn-helix domain-containing protein n=1 Tax=Streptomyces niphimycinicus TaxID=2842201 RepID=A0ABS6CLF4_9ACTN|nr:helix-turn-helix transcriptional regulator [Streptomyces niphimycinicus]MBU3867747.1 helix-turn-helix domain-containing protein [Streptomyces niphimycinicus]
MPGSIDSSTESIGARIREFRLIRNYSLSELGRRAHVSTSQLCRIENGERYPSEPVVASVARALGVGVSVLRGQPYIQALQKDQLDALLTPISTSFDDWDIPPEDAPPPRALDALEAEIERIVRLRVKAEFLDIAARLPGLISEIAVTTQMYGSPGQHRERAHDLQAEVSRTAAIVAYRLGYMDLARLALSRMAVAAPQSGDPRQVAVERYERAQMAADNSRLDRGVSLMRHALRDLDDDGDRATRAVRGTLQLRAAVLSARNGDDAAAGDWLGEAAELAERIGETRHYALAFGPLNVRLHQIAAAGDRDEHAEALEHALQVRLPDDYPPTRAAHYWIDRARAEAWTAQHGDALGSLRSARESSPQLTRYHHSVHETAATLLRARQRADEQLREYAEWCGV